MVQSTIENFCVAVVAVAVAVTCKLHIFAYCRNYFFIVFNPVLGMRVFKSIPLLVLLAHYAINFHF